MHELAELRDYVRFFVTLLAVLDPFLAVPIYVGATAARSEDYRRALSRVVTLTVFAVLATSAVVGEELLSLMGASLPAFRVGGGLVLLLMALAMLNAQAGGVRQSEAEAEELEAGRLSGVVPPCRCWPGPARSAPRSSRRKPAASATGWRSCCASSACAPGCGSCSGSRT